MDLQSTNPLIFWSLLIIVPAVFLLFKRSARGPPKNLPPGPRGWPLVGYMFQLGSLPYVTLAGIREKYGPVVWFKIGSTNTMAILSASAAAEFFKKHDQSFLDRSIVDTMKAHNFSNESMALAPYGPFWRLMKRISTTEMFVTRRINETVPLRRKCVENMLSFVAKAADSDKGKSGIHVARYIFLASFNMLGNLMFSRDVAEPESKNASEFFDAMVGVMEWAGRPNISDVFPWLSRFDLHGFRKNMDRDMGKVLEIASTIVQERMKERQQTGRTNKDLMDVMLNFRGNGKDELEKFTERSISIFTMEIFIGGSESTSATVEWALTELLRHPAEMKKVKAELDKVVGPNRKLAESDYENLPYLQAVGKEALRLHPPIPFLIPRRSTEDTTFMGYHIPKNTQVFVNVWALSRDPDCWTDPSSFKPERFLGSDIDMMGQHYQLLPFGAGRRMCVGYLLAYKMFLLLLGSLLHEFDWEPEKGVTVDAIDIRERAGITVRKVQPLKALPKKRHN